VPFTLVSVYQFLRLNPVSARCRVMVSPIFFPELCLPCCRLTVQLLEKFYGISPNNLTLGFRMDFLSQQHPPITPSFGGREWDTRIIPINYFYVASSLQSLQTNQFWKCHNIIHAVNLHVLLMP